MSWFLPEPQHGVCFHWVGNPVRKNGHKGHVAKSGCPTDRTDFGMGGCWHLRTALKLDHLGGLVPDNTQ